MAATWYAVTDASGNLLSTGTVVDAEESYAARGLTLTQLDGDPSGKVWDAASKTFSDAPAPQNVYTTSDWVSRFTAAEYMAFRNSTDQNIQFFMYILDHAPTVTPQGAQVQQGLGYAAQIGLLTPDRAAAIGAN
jgi:hypothetical protein